MKILWCDDKAKDPKEFEGFIRDWHLEDRREDIVAATSDAEALRLLKETPEIGLLILDLLWEGQPEHPTVRPLGVDYLENIRRFYPDLRVATRSVIARPDSLAALVHNFVDLRVTDHFVSHEGGCFADLRKRLVLEAAERSSARHARQDTESGLRVHVGEEWGAVLFADISGFTMMTEQLWYRNRDALCTALSAFYDRAIDVVRENHGIVDKLIGDEIMAVFFGGPGDGTRAEAVCHCVDAARALLICFRDLERRFRIELDDEDEAVDRIHWKLKAGAEAGQLMIIEKLLPGDEREFCVIGRAVNLASRIKGLVGDYSLTIGPTMRQKLPQRDLYEAVLVDVATPLKGISGSTRLYRLANE